LAQLSQDYSVGPVASLLESHILKKNSDEGIMKEFRYLHKYAAKGKRIAQFISIHFMRFSDGRQIFRNIPFLTFKYSHADSCS
jgi:hypothetical protein